MKKAPVLILKQS